MEPATKGAAHERLLKKLSKKKQRQLEEAFEQQQAQSAQRRAQQASAQQAAPAATPARAAASPAAEAAHAVATAAVQQGSNTAPSAQTFQGDLAATLKAIQAETPKKQQQVPAPKAPKLKTSKPSSEQQAQAAPPEAPVPKAPEPSAAAGPPAAEAPVSRQPDVAPVQADRRTKKQDQNKGPAAVRTEPLAAVLEEVPVAANAEPPAAKQGRHAAGKAAQPAQAEPAAAKQGLPDWGKTDSRQAKGADVASKATAKPSNSKGRLAVQQQAFEGAARARQVQDAANGAPPAKQGGGGQPAQPVPKQPAEAAPQAAPAAKPSPPAKPSAGKAAPAAPQQQPAKASAVVPQQPPVAAVKTPPPVQQAPAADTPKVDRKQPGRVEASTAAAATFASAQARELAAAQSLGPGPATGGQRAAGALHVEKVSFMYEKTQRLSGIVMLVAVAAYCWQRAPEGNAMHHRWPPQVIWPVAHAANPPHGGSIQQAQASRL